MKTVTKLLPGCAIALVLAAIAKGLESWEASAGLHLIGASVIALFLGMIVNRFYKAGDNDILEFQTPFTSMYVPRKHILFIATADVLT